MANPKKGNSLVWGIILIIIGGVILLEQLDIDVFDQVWRFWPVILIIWGANKLWLGLKEQRTSAPKRRVRTRAMKFREVLLVVVLILAGFVFFQFKTGNWNIDGDWGWDWDGFGAFSREYAAEETRTIEAPLPPALEIENGHGWVEVRGADQGTIELTFKKVAWRRTEEEAKEVADRLKYTLTTAPDKLTLATNRDEFSRRNFETGFVLTVPRAMIVRVVNSYGSVRIDGVAEATVVNRNGEVFASDVGGACRVETSYDDIDVQRVGGECRIVNRNGDVRAGSVTGDLWIETSYARRRRRGRRRDGRHPRLERRGRRPARRRGRDRGHVLREGLSSPTSARRRSRPGTRP